MPASRFARSIRLSALAAAACLAGGVAPMASAQPSGQSGLDQATSAGPGVTAPTDPSAVLSAPRQFAPGVETVIPTTLDPAETITRHDLVEIRADKSLEWTPALVPEQTLYTNALGARFPRTIWQLDFGFKPLRMIRLVDEEGNQQLVWYLIYRVRNTGEALRPTSSEENGEFRAETVASGPIRFQPHFVLQAHDVAPDGGKLYRAYLDKPLRQAVESIRRRETPGRQLYTATTMPLEELAEGEERWGVAMWTDVDPEIDFFSVFARGLTNVYDWVDPEGAYKPGDPPGTGREFVRKVLQLNFWRPGDRFLQHEGEVRFGVAPGKADLYGVEEGVEYVWVYR
ncbi:hypothetical protein [Botrimarina sp.]|uniref:hypothetical protein n=1 Tax=Botrimarina sp. TaxID=2795802 RepID=UPI0032F09594